MVDAIVKLDINTDDGVFIPLDPRWLSNISGYTVSSPTPVRLGPNGELGVVSYIMDSSYNREPHYTLGVSFVHRSLW